MSNLSKEEKEVILDFYFRCGEEERINRGRDLIAGNPEAAQLYANLEDSLRQLDSVKYEPCPENLVELTVAKLKLAASSEQARLESLLAAEQRKTAHMESPDATTSRSFWRNVAEVAAIAAVVLVIAGVSMPSLSRMRQVSVSGKSDAYGSGDCKICQRQQRCVSCGAYEGGFALVESWGPGRGESVEYATYVACGAKGIS